MFCTPCNSVVYVMLISFRWFYGIHTVWGVCCLDVYRSHWTVGALYKDYLNVRLHFLPHFNFEKSKTKFRSQENQPQVWKSLNVVYEVQCNDYIEASSHYNSDKQAKTWYTLGRSSIFSDGTHSEIPESEM